MATKGRVDEVDDDAPERHVPMLSASRTWHKTVTQRGADHGNDSAAGRACDAATEQPTTSAGESFPVGSEAMTCRYCREQAGWWRRRCAGCRRLLSVFEAHRGLDFRSMMQLFVDSGIAAEKIEKFLEADPEGTGSVRDQITADMSNDLMRALGNDTRQTAADVKKLRARGNWVNLDRRPPE